MAKGHGKGSGFERDICKRLSLWWTGGQQDDIFWRIGGSGGRATNRSKKNKSTAGQYGDIQATDPIGQQLIDFTTFECKTGYGNSHLGELIDCQERHNPLYKQFIKQAEEEHRHAKSFTWTLIARRKGRDILIIFPYNILSILKILLKSLSSYAVIKYEDRKGAVVAFPFNDFIKLANPEDIILWMRKFKDD